MTLNLESAELPADAIEVGRVLDAWGIKGWFKVLPYSARPEALFSSKRWYLLPADRGVKTFDGTRLMRIKEAKEHADTVVASSHEVLDRNDAEALKGARIFVARSSFPTPDQDEFYWVDLLGLNVVNREGVDLGVVRDLLSTGPQSVLVIEAVEGDKTVERMIPFVGAFIDRVDLPGRCILVDWQADY